MLREPLKKGHFWETHIAYRLALIHSTQFKPTIWTLSYLRTHQLHHLASRMAFSNTITSHRKTAVLLKLSNLTFAEFFTSIVKV